jgi:hypothetical protein
MACLIATLFTFYHAATYLVPKAVQVPDLIGMHFLNLFFVLSHYVGPAIAGAWLVHGLMGRRFLSVRGVEFWGFLVGCGWLSMFFITTTLPWFETLVQWL